MRSGWVVLTLAVAAMTLLSAAAHAEGVQAAKVEAGAGVGGGDADPSALIEADADLRQMQAEAQSEAHIVFVPSSDAADADDADADADADSEGESDVESATEEAVDAEGEGESEAEAESDADQEADSEADAESESEADSEGAEEADEVEAGTLLLSEEEQTAFSDAVMGAVDDASDAATEAEGDADEGLTDAESAAATMRFASVRSQLAVRAQRSFEAVAKAAIRATKHAAKVGDGEAESLSMAVAKQMGDSLLKTVGTGLAHKLGTSLAEKIGGWQRQIKALSEQQSASEPGGAMRFAAAKGRDPRWFPPPVPVHMTDSMRNEPADITAVAPSHRSDKTPEDVEDCVACRYVWLQVEQDVGNSAIEETVYDSFFQNALEAQKTPIFYPGCQTMFDQVDDMLGDYMDGYAVDQMCENAMLCR